MDADSPSLASAVRPSCLSMLIDFGYPGAPQPSPEAVEVLLNVMHKRAVDIGLPLDTPISRKGFWLGYSEGLLAHPGHPVEVQAYVGLITWLVVQFDDIVGQEGRMREASSQFHERFFRGETQPNALLNGIATMIREAPVHFDAVLATLLQHSDGAKFPYYFRAMSGMDIAYAIFCYPKALYTDIGCFIEAIPDMGIFINISNDVLSFYKEELGGDKRNYIHNRARSEQRDVLQVLAEVEREAIDCEHRIQKILKGRAEYAKSWSDSVRGYMAMHTTNPRYRLAELGLGEEHPLTYMKSRLGSIESVAI
ncbi:hypothetical protein G7054_g9753 [Neopestalotiopsis clavispora]|nr:hypothetical protein G7054_g9753 [Neopestalotiopsis clavispora]